MIIGIVTGIGKIAFRYRKQIYRVLVAQDRAIDRAFKVGGYSRQTRFGARHGALAGSIIGSLISNNAPDTPGNDNVIFQKRPRKPQQSKTYKPYQTRNRPTRRCTPRSQFRKYPDFRN